MQQSNGAGVRLVIPKEYQLPPPVRAPRKKSPVSERGCERSSGAECGVTPGTPTPDPPSSPPLSRTQVSLPRMDAEPPSSDAADFETTRERNVLLEEGLDESPVAHNNGGDDGRREPSEGRDPTGLEATVRRIVGAPDDPTVAEYVAGGHPRDAVTLGLAMWGSDKRDRVVQFCVGFEQMAGMGFRPEHVAGALASNDNDVEKAIAACLSESRSLPPGRQ